MCRHDQLTASVATYGPLLISRFKEREENVRIDVISAYISLLKEIHHAVPNAVKSLAVGNMKIFPPFLYSDFTG